MIALIIKSYLTVLLSVAAGAVLLFVTGLYFIFRKQTSVAVSAPNNPVKIPVNVTANDMQAIAGDDVIATQLDLARAYIETGKKQLAKKILEQVMTQGSDSQQQEARQLSGSC